MTLEPGDTRAVIHYDFGQGEEEGICVSDFLAYMPTHSYIFMPTGEMWAAPSVNARIDKIDNMSATSWLDRNRPVEQMTWFPGEPPLIEGKLATGGGWIERDGVTVFNQYRQPTITLGDPAKAKPFIDHINRVYPEEAGHIIKWLAQRVQYPGEKINHALVLGGAQGIGKDTILEPVKRAIGHWNFAEVSPQQLLVRFNGFLKSVILRISEARDLGDIDRFKFYDHTKAYTAAPPDMLLCDEKHVRPYHIPNLVGLVITTNYKTDGIYLAPDDRRHFIAWSEANKEDFPEKYWIRLWKWYENGGFGHVAAYLAKYDLSGFDPKAPPPKTPAFWDIVDANRSTEEAELQDAIEKLGYPQALTIDDISRFVREKMKAWLKENKNLRRIPHRLEEVGYVKARNPDADKGLWRVNGRRQAIYVRKELPIRDRDAAARSYYDGRGK